MSARAEGPELSLARAVLEDAIYCYQRQFVSSSRPAQRLGREAELWIFSDDTSWAFSFVNLCDALAINPHSIRRALRRALPQHPASWVQRKKHVGAPRRTLKIAA